MKHLKYLIVTVLLVLLAVPALAQDGTTPANTITVVGTGNASGTPDNASIQFGVELRSQDLSTVFSDVNAAIDQVINAVVEAGVAPEDVRTVGLNVYQERGMVEPMMSDEGNGQVPTTYIVSNQINVTVRDIDSVPDVIDAAIAAGSNQIYGLEFRISDTDMLESDARSAAIEDANARAAELANLVGATLGNVVSVEEAQGGFSPYGRDMALGMGGGGGTSIAPGQLQVSLQVRVTYELVR